MTPGELLLLRSRGDIRRAGEWLDGPGREVREALLNEARRRGVDPGDDALELPGKKLLRRCMSRTDAAQVRSNPIHRDEAFLCVACAREVPMGGRRPRDHCPWCLVSLHVDVIPGDRAARCGGQMSPVAIEGGDLLYRCAACGAARRNRILDDVVPPDDPGALRRIGGGPG